MDRRSLLASLLAMPFSMSAQTYYYIDHIDVSPAAPTTSDPVTVTLIGNLSATNSYIVLPPTASVTGFNVDIVVNSGSSGIGIPTLVPHNETFSLGTLPAGTYTITISGTFTGDLAPASEHNFIVSGGGSPCDSLIVESVQWAPFTDTALVVHVTNNSSELFDYPGWILFDGVGDTLARETVDLFGIAGESWHILTIHPGATIPTGSLTGTLELWTGFYTELACTFPWTGDPCPDTCVVVYPQMSNTGGALVVANIDWTITDDDGIPVGSGQFEFDTLNQYAIDPLCLLPGAYTLSVNHAGAVGGSLQFWLNTAGLAFGTAPQLFTQDGVPDLMPFDYFPGCFEGMNGLIEAPAAGSLVVSVSNGMLHVASTDGRAMGALELLDLRGRVVAAGTSASDRIDMDVSRYGKGLYLLRAAERSWCTRVVID